MHSGITRQQLAEVQALHGELQASERRLAAIRASEKERLQKIDTFKFQIEDIEKPGLYARPGRRARK